MNFHVIVFHFQVFEFLMKLCRFLVERGALIFLNDKDETIGTEAIYEKIAGGKYGCSWDAFQAYKHLKSLGYIVGRYGVPWTSGGGRRKF
jgi:hypothetical protein